MAPGALILGALTPVMAPGADGRDSGRQGNFLGELSPGGPPGRMGPGELLLGGLAPSGGGRSRSKCLLGEFEWSLCGALGRICIGPGELFWWG
eukprot:4429107-Pyramimonas_sp.AAC.1